jgi:hypothetical protein
VSRLDGLRRFWASVRPRTRRGAVLATLAVVAGSGLLAVGLFVGATMAWSPYLDSVVHPDSNPRAWAALEPAFAPSGICADCHAPQAEKAASANHEGIGCASCHGPALDHAVEAAATPAVALSELETPTDDLCVRCHAAVVGRPENLRQVEIGAHYVRECLQCHDPHTGLSRRPPVVLHPLEHLPACVTCHGEDGFKARNQRHPADLPDESCMDCHAAGRGPEAD